MICKKPKNHTVLQSLKFKVISETCIYDLFKQKSPGFIEEAAIKGDTTITNNLADLLQSNDPQNIAIGLEMLKTGGVPAVLIDTLLIVFKTCKDSKIRGEAKKLLLKNAASDLLPLINDTQRFTSILTQKAQEINLKLEKVAKNSSPELAADLSILFQKHLKKGLRYVLYHFHKPSEIRTRALLSLMDDGHFNFHEGLGFTNWKKRDNLDDVTIYKLETKNKFPVDIVDHTTVTSANFHNCKFTTISIGIGNFKDVKKLDLSYNLAKKLPNSFQKLKQLEHLDLQMNSFEKFPEVLLKLPKLKFIDFRRNTIQHVLSPIKITDGIKLALSNCEILV